MNDFMRGIKKHSEFVAMILLFCAAGFTLLYHTGGFRGEFLPVMSNLISMILHIALWGIYPLLLVIGKRRAAKCAIKAVAIYWVPFFLFDVLTQIETFAWEGFSVGVAAGVFGFLIVCALITAAVFAVISIHKKDEMKKRITLFILSGTLVLLLVFFALMIAVYADVLAEWNMYFELLSKYLALPFGMVFVLLAYFYKEEELTFFKEKPARTLPAEAETEESSVEPVGDVSANEAPVDPVAEETPAVTVEETPIAPEDSLPEESPQEVFEPIAEEESAAEESAVVEPVAEEVPTEEMPSEVEFKEVRAEGDESKE